MSGRRILVLVAALLAAPRPAAADEPDRPQWQYGFSFAGGASQIGGLGFGQIGLQLRLGRQVVPDLRAVVLADLLGTYRGNGERQVMGETLRGTLGVEWDAGRWGDRSIFGGVLTVVGGGGSELITWERGLVARPLAYLGVQTSIGFIIPRDSRMLRGFRWMGQILGVRAIVASGIAPDKVPMQCGGPCDAPSRAATLELGFVAYMGLDFGR